METEFALSLGTQRWTLSAGGDDVTIGRASNASVRLQADDQISRIHARLTRTGTTWTLHDESRNGTGLNGRRLAAPTPLTDNDRIHIGRSVLTFHESQPAPAPSAFTSPPTSSAPPPTAPPAAASTPSAPPAATPAPTPAAPPVTPATPRPTPAAPPSATPAGQYPSHEPHSPANAPTPFTEDPAAPAPPAPRATPPPAGAAPPPTHDERGQRPFEPGAGERRPFESEQRPFEPGAGEQRPFESEQRPFEPEERERRPFNFAESEPHDAPAPPPAAPDGPRRTDAPSNFPLFPADPSYPDSGEPPYQGPGEPGDRAPDAAWAAYPSADNPEPARSPWDNPPAAQIEQSQPNWNESASWPDIRQGDPPDHRLPSADRTTGDRGRNGDRDRTRNRDRDRAGVMTGEGDEEVGTVRLLRVLLIAAFIIVLGLLINLTVTFLADGPGGALRWLIPPAIALVVAMIVALLDAAAPTNRAPSRLDVSIIIAIVVVLLGVGVGGFALTAGAQYVGGYLTGNESGEDRLIKPVAKPAGSLTVTVENVTYTSHFTRVEVKLTNAGKQPVSLPLTNTATLAGEDGSALRADTSRSQWPGSIPNGGSDHGTITFKGHLPDATTSATLTLKSGDAGVAVAGLTLSN